MENKEQKWQKVGRMSRRSALASLISLIALVLFFIIARRVYPSAPAWAAPVIVIFFGLISGFGLAAVILFLIQAAMRVFSRKDGGGQKPAEETARVPQEGKSKRKISRLLFGWLILGIAVSIGFQLYYAYVPKKCDTTECFIAAANDCRRVELDYVDEADVFWKYRAPAGCGRFEKTAVLLNNGEADWTKELLEGKSLSCDYARGNFDERWLTSPVFGLESCHGELKEALGQLLFLLQ